ncbi:MAG: GNAT family N-acetyltransferase [Syntrophaceae bacterium]|nr:GNAT family N-acetyltransferase [Syntrophaceae bacterium]
MKTQNFKLVETTDALINIKNELIEFADEIGKEQDHLLEPSLLREDSLAYLRLLNNWSQGIGLPIGWVPSSQFWYLSDESKVIGFSSLRHFLTTSLEDFGGHISYVVRPKYQRQGHGTQILASTLNKAKALGLVNVLLTTDVHNIGSRKVIEHNGGKLEKEYLSTNTCKMKARYLIILNGESSNANSSDCKKHGW